MIRLVEVLAENRELFWNIHQKYLYEMTKYYDDEMDERGNYHYGYFDAYFSEVERKAFLIYTDKLLVGFAKKYPIKLEDKYIIYMKDLKYEDNVLYMPIYMTACL